MAAAVAGVPVWGGFPFGRILVRISPEDLLPRLRQASRPGAAYISRLRPCRRAPSWLLDLDLDAFG